MFDYELFNVRVGKKKVKSIYYKFLLYINNLYLYRTNFYITMHNKTSQRFREILTHLKEHHLIPSARQLALKIGVHPQCISDIMTGKRPVNSDIIEKCANEYDFNLNYLYRGEGSIMNEPSIEAGPASRYDAPQERIVYVPIEAQAGYSDQYNDTIYMQELPSFSLPGSRYRSGTYRCFDVSGDSMEPTIYSGDQLICEMIEQQYWHKQIKNRYVYIIITNTDVVVKRIINKIEEDGTIMLVSDNSYYGSTELFVGDIREIWKVTTKITPFMPSPNNVRNGFDKVVENLKDTITDQSKVIQSLNSTIEKLLKQSRLSRV